MVPIAGKGLGEGDGSNVDCNYGVGLWGDVLGADFEDMATGANHPVTGQTAIPRGEWQSADGKISKPFQVRIVRPAGKSFKQ